MTIASVLKVVGVLWMLLLGHKCDSMSSCAGINCQIALSNQAKTCVSAWLRWFLLNTWKPSTVAKSMWLRLCLRRREAAKPLSRLSWALYGVKTATLPSRAFGKAFSSPEQDGKPISEEVHSEKGLLWCSSQHMHDFFSHKIKTMLFAVDFQSPNLHIWDSCYIIKAFHGNNSLPTKQLGWTSLPMWLTHN